MCGICASFGEKNQIENVLKGLSCLEYRGYDSSGIAYMKKGKLEIIKSVGQIKFLKDKITPAHASQIVIGHTRWATHGKVCEENSHPHLSADGKVAIVHNGIIENFEKLKENMTEVKFYSQTDTEVFANLIARQDGKNLEKLVEASKKIDGSFAVAVIFENDKKIFCGKRKSPLYVAVRQGQIMAASDISAFEDNFDFFYVLEDDEFAVLEKERVEFFDSNYNHLKKQKKMFEKNLKINKKVLQ